MASPPPFEEFMYELRIPRERVAVLIGTKGEQKKVLEAATKTKIEVDSAEGEVRIMGKDALNLYLCREVVRAVGRGFNPDTALLLLKPDYGFEVVNIMHFAKSSGHLRRLRGRVIGEGGKSRRIIEEMTGTKISIYGKTVGIIGPLDSLLDAKKAVESLLSGSPHAHVYSWLEKRQKRVRL